MKYNPIYKPKQIITGTGQTVIVTGWTIKERVVKAIAKSGSDVDYAAIAQLYSPTRGINLLIRNLLANPQVKTIILLNATREDKNSGSIQCLADFFVNGVSPGISQTGRDCWVINSDVVGYIDKEVAITDLTHLRQSLIVRHCRSLAEVVVELASAESKPKHSWGEPRIFPYTEPTIEIVPGDRYVHRIEADTIAEVWVKILHRILKIGTPRPTGYGGQWQELINLVAVVRYEPEGFYFPEPNYLPCDRESIKNYIPQILDDAPYVEGVKYTYGQRLRSWFGKDQVEQVIQKLIGEVDAASAVMSLWDSGNGSWESSFYSQDDPDTMSPNTIRQEWDDDDCYSDHDKGGSPCLNHIWVRVVDNELSMTATFRSNDMFSAWPSNAMGLRALQVYIRDRVAKGLGQEFDLGPLITISQSAHIYDDCWENAKTTVEKHYKEITRKEQCEYADPAGNFIIESERGEIIVSHLSPECETVQIWKGKSALKLIRAISTDCPHIHPAHIGYLGVELHAAEVQGNDYRQDQCK